LRNSLIRRHNTWSHPNCAPPHNYQIWASSISEQLMWPFL
jgi:hypothetical protein